MKKKKLKQKSQEVSEQEALVPQEDVNYVVPFFFLFENA